MQNETVENSIGLVAVATLVFLMVILPAIMAYTAEGLLASIITAVFYAVFWSAILIPLGLAQK
jgi:hypothetical protein